jgi:hypothetical protein
MRIVAKWVHGELVWCAGGGILMLPAVSIIVIIIMKKYVYLITGVGVAQYSD